MALRDLFKPKWQHSDPEIRLRAAKKLSDRNIAQAVYADLARTGIWPYVLPMASTACRIEAVEALTDQAVLAEVARQDCEPKVRLCAAKELNDHTTAQEVYTQVAQHGTYALICIQAVLALTDKAALAQIVNKKNFAEVRLAAAIKLSNPGIAETIYADVTQNDRLPDMMKAVAKLSDEQVLADIAKNGDSHWIRAAAAKKVHDQRLIAELLKAEPGPKEEEQHTPFRGGDPVVWDSIVEYESEVNSNLWKSWHDAFCGIVLTRVTDQALLVDIAKNAAHPDLRKAAANRVDDQLLLADIAKNHRDFGN